MNILVNSGLSDKKLYSKIKPLSILDKIKNIIIVRDNKGINLSKCQYYYLEDHQLKNKVIKIIIKLFVSMKLIRDKNVDLIISYYLFTHGLRALITSIFLRKKLVISLIGTDLDINIKQSSFRKF